MSFAQTTGPFSWHNSCNLCHSVRPPSSDSDRLAYSTRPTASTGRPSDPIATGGGGRVGSWGEVCSIAAAGRGQDPETGVV
ncbi:unnamed protein product [Protopolystoma xenopodis]|uniref:Uncharacterized protein n=1 Tax=Protopolystoma xenopodis TaxID=117903 RepID=A0A448X8W8_9PLAT|nr:unnamed protein product [Protopolystoma xenopodis]